MSNLPTLENIQIALELGLCPWCGGEAVRAQVGQKQRCRPCNSKWEVTPYGGIQVVQYPVASMLIVVQTAL